MLKNFKTKIINNLINLLEKIFKLKTYIRIFILITFDTAIIISSLSIASILLSVDNFYYLKYQNYSLLFLLILVSIPIYFLTGQYNDLTRFTGSKSIYQIMIRNSLVLFINYIVLSIPLSLAFVIWTFISSISYTLRIFLTDIVIRLNNRSNIDSGILIYGAGAAGARLLNILRQENKLFVKGFIDENPSLWGRSILGINIYPPSELEKIKKSKKVKKIVLAIPSLSKDNLRRILNELSCFNLNVLQIPKLTDIINGNSKIDNLRPINFDDLLGRDAVPLKYDLLEKDLKGSNIIVTGAGGSIGSQLCRELSNFKPAKIILFEISEPSLYEIHQELLNLNSITTLFVPILGSVTDKNLVQQVIQDNNVNIIFHAAAYKHVPLVEMNPLQGILNNILSTRILCECAKINNVKKFILISSDKAVRPTSIMGVSKRISELILQGSQNYASKSNFSSTSNTIFLMVRFGNVINSSGSVIPLFQKQIKDGGPITLTHEKITRYFMTINEACLLVIQASYFAEGGDLFLLDMGKPVKIRKIAEQMISLSGLSLKDDSNPEGDIEIVVTGLRPGEKLYEELLIENNAISTKHPLIFKAKESYIEYSVLEMSLKELEKRCIEQDLLGALLLLEKLVPEWKRS